MPRGPRAVSDLSVEQEAADATLTFSYPDRLLTGLALTDLESIEVYRIVNPSSLLAAPRPQVPGSVPPTDEAPAAAARRAALNVRVAEEAFYRDAERIAVLPSSALAERARGATVVYRDSLSPLFAKKPTPASLAYAVVSVRRGGERSPLSNIASLAPDIPPGPPVHLAATPEEGRICLEWLAPERNLLGQHPAEIGGYFVYRRELPEEEYDKPLNAEPLNGTSYVDTAAPTGAKILYTVRASLAGKPRIEGPPGEEVAVDFRDVFPPAAPARLDALSEAGLVRLVWDPVPAADLAGYAIFRREPGAAAVRLNSELVKDSFFTDTSVRPGKRYAYVVRSVDTAGNSSPPTGEASAEPF